MKEFILLLGIMVFWIALNRWILPWFGISTCMSGGCAADRCPSCEPGPWTQTEKDAESKGSEP